MQNRLSFRQLSISLILALLATFLCAALWKLARLVSFDSAFLVNGASPAMTPFPGWALIASITFLSLGTALAVELAGARRVVPYAAGVLLMLAVCSLGVSRLFAVDIQFTFLLISVVGSASLVQSRRLWLRERALGGQLIRSVKKLSSLEGADARFRLMSGLKLIQLVLSTNEAVVFRRDSNSQLVSAARLRASQSGPLDPSRNSSWREGIALCERAIKTGSIIVLPASTNSPLTIVAIPLRHEDRSVGALLVRLNQGFEENDRALLSAVGAQMARNLQREEACKAAAPHWNLSVLSTEAADKKFESLYALNGLISEQRFGIEILSEISDGLAIAYLDGTIAFANANFLRYADLEASVIGSSDLFALLDKLRTDVFDEPSIAVRRVLQTGEPYERELDFSDRNATYGLRISLVKSTAKGEEGEPLCLAVHVTDLTGSKEYEKLKSDMISLMSHELRTPLTSINGFAELLSADEELPEQAKEFVTIIANESQRLSRMINTFLAVTQLQRKDKQEVLKIPLRLDEIAREIVIGMQPVARKRRIRLVEQQQAQRLPPVAADKSLITQAVKNLVTNAIKYSPEKTTVTVSTALEAEAVRVSVEDRGYGIPAEARDRVWEKFYRVVREGQEKDEESTGLGLAFVREVIEQHGGQVDLETEEGRGSKFSFTLPRL